jgi:membrane protein DedA with SNARE-associated domain
MIIPQLLNEYGYLAVFAGSLLEGETVLVLGGFAAHQGYLSLPWVMFLAFIGGTIGDQIFFFVGRHWGDAVLRRLPSMHDNAKRIDQLLLRHHAGVIVGVRFMYGVRIVGPIVIGMSHVPARRFLLFNMIGAALWAIAIAGAGYVFGQTLEHMLADLDQYEWVAAVLILALAIAVGVARSRRASKRRNSPSGGISAAGPSPTIDR